MFILLIMMMKMTLLVMMMMMEMNIMVMTSLCNLLFENLKFLSRFGADLRIVTPYRVESIGKMSIFGLNTTINR